MGGTQERKAAIGGLALPAGFWVALVVVPDAIPALDALGRLVDSGAVRTVLVVAVFKWTGVRRNDCKIVTRGVVVPAATPGEWSQR